MKEMEKEKASTKKLKKYKQSTNESLRAKKVQ